MKNKLGLRLEKVNADLLNLLIFSLGMIAIFIGGVISKDWNMTCPLDVKTILISVGCSLVATSLVSILTSRYLVKRQQVKDLIETWGVESVFATRQRMNARCDEAQLQCERCIDIIAMGLKSWRDSQSDRIREKLGKKVKIRILAPHPASYGITQRTLDEKEIEGQIAHSLNQLQDWVEGMKQYGNIELKFYNALPENLYFRIDDTIFIGPYLYGCSSQQTISYEYKAPGKVFKIYSDHFEKLWVDETFLNTSELESRD